MTHPRFILFLGKGGVGKTTLSAAYGIHCANLGLKTLMLSLHNSQKLSSIFHTPIPDDKIVSLQPNLHATTITPSYAIKEYVLLKLKFQFIYKAVFQNSIITSFLNAIPGLNDLLMLGKAYYHVIEENEDKTPKWDRVILDAPATGHGIFFLKIPNVITSILSSGNMYEDAHRMQNVLSDPQTTQLNLITLPEELPVNEALMMINTASEQLHLPISNVIANAVLPDLLTPFQDQLSPLIKARHHLNPESKDLYQLLDAAAFRLERHQAQQQQLEKIASHLNATVPFLFSNPLQRQDLETIGALLHHQLSQ